MNPENHIATGYDVGVAVRGDLMKTSKPSMVAYGGEEGDEVRRDELSRRETRVVLVG